MEDAIKFEDFVAHKLYDAGIPIGVHRSRSYQRYGESRAGFEIKHDMRRVETQNLFIETEERSTASVDTPLKPAGIYAEDNSWLYVIGDYHKLWIFANKTLRQLHATGRYKDSQTIDKQSGVVTAKGFLLPVSDADRYAAKIMDFSKCPAS